MPSYGTTGGVYELYPKIGSLSTITTAVIESYIGRAEAWANGQLANRYTIPVSGSPPILKEIVETRATYLILRRFFSQEKENTSEWVESWKEDAENMLDPYVTGSATLVGSDGTRLAPSLVTGIPWSSTDAYKPTFDVREQIAQRVDPDRVQADEDKDI